MLFFDYTFDIDQGHLALDKEITADKIGWAENDLFRVKIVNGQIILVKLESVETFIHSKLVKSEVDK